MTLEYLGREQCFFFSFPGRGCGNMVMKVVAGYVLALWGTSASPSLDLAPAGRGSEHLSDVTVSG